MTIRNAESAEIRDVEVWFDAEGYTTGPALCASFPYLRKGAVADAPLVAAFSDQVMTVTENVRRITSYNVCYTKLLRSDQVSALRFMIDTVVSPRATRGAPSRV